MFVLRKIILLLNPILIFLTFELVRRQGGWFWLLLLLILLFLLFTLWDFTKQKISQRFLALALSPVLLFGLSFLFLIFNETQWLFYTVEILTAVLIYLYLSQVLNYFYLTSQYQPYTLERFSVILNLFAVFYLFSSFFAAVVFLQINLALAVAGVSAFIAFISYQFFWSQKIPSSDSLIFSWVITLVLAELFLVISYLPTSHFVGGALMTGAFYLTTELSRVFLAHEWCKEKVWKLVLVSGVSVFLILFWARFS